MSGGFAKNSIFGALAGISILISNFISGVVVARLLGVEASGEVAYFVWLVFLLAPAIDAGMPAAATRYIPELRARGDGDVVGAVRRMLLRRLFIAVALATAGIAVLSVAAPAIDAYLTGRSSSFEFLQAKSHWALLCTLLAAQVLGSFTYAALRGEQRFSTLFAVTTTSLAFQVAGVAIGAALFGVTGALFGYLAGQLPPMIGALRSRRGGGELDPELRNRLTRYARHAWLANIAAAFVWSKIEVLFLAQAWGSAAVGLFTTALALTSLASQGPVMLTNAILPMLSAHRGRDDRAAIAAAFASGTRLLAMMVFPACLGMAAITPQLLPLIYGSAFADAVPAAIILAIAAAVSATTVVGANLVYAMDRNDFFVRSHLVGAVASVALGLLAVPTFGLLGAAIGRAALQIGLNVALIVFIRRRLGFEIPFAALGKTFAAACVSSGAAVCVGLAVAGPWSIPIAVIVAAVVYLIALRVFRAAPDEDVALLGRTFESFPGLARAPASRLLAFIGR